MQTTTTEYDPFSNSMTKCPRILGAQNGTNPVSEDQENISELIWDKQEGDRQRTRAEMRGGRGHSSE